MPLFNLKKKKKKASYYQLAVANSIDFPPPHMCLPFKLIYFKSILNLKKYIHNQINLAKQGFSILFILKILLQPLCVTLFPVTLFSYWSFYFCVEPACSRERTNNSSEMVQVKILFWPFIYGLVLLFLFLFAVASVTAVLFDGKNNTAVRRQRRWLCLVTCVDIERTAVSLLLLSFHGLRVSNREQGAVLKKTIL